MTAARSVGWRNFMPKPCWPAALNSTWCLARHTRAYPWPPPWPWSWRGRGATSHLLTTARTSRTMAKAARWWAPRSRGGGGSWARGGPEGPPCASRWPSSAPQGPGPRRSRWHWTGRKKTPKTVARQTTSPSRTHAPQLGMAGERKEKATEEGCDADYSAVQYARRQLGLGVCAIGRLADLLQYLTDNESEGMRLHRDEVLAYRQRYGVNEG